MTRQGNGNLVAHEHRLWGAFTSSRRVPYRHVHGRIGPLLAFGGYLAAERAARTKPVMISET
jgi:hypothetical protein